MIVDARTVTRAEVASPQRQLEAANGAEALIQLLVAHGVQYLFLNPGTDTAPVQEAIVALEARGHAVPQIVSCLYENVALAAAHGYFCMTAAAGRAGPRRRRHPEPGGQPPQYPARPRRRPDLRRADAVHRGRGCPGSRDRGIQWFQDQPDQIGIVRGYVKWFHELGRTDTLNYLIPRAVQVAASEPAGRST